MIILVVEHQHIMILVSSTNIMYIDTNGENWSDVWKIFLFSLNPCKSLFSFSLTLTILTFTLIFTYSFYNVVMFLIIIL